MNQAAVYLYGFGRAAELTDFAVSGIEPGRDVCALPFGELAALVSVVTPGLVAPTADTISPDEQARIIGQAVRHQEAVAAAFARSPVLPVRYGAVFSSRDALGALVEAHRGRIAEFLARVAGREEWAVKCSLHTQKAVEALIARDPELAARRAQLPATPGAKYFQEKRLHADAERRVNASLAGRLDEVRAELGATAEGVCELRRPSADGATRLVSHDAFLVPRERVPEWLARLDAVAARLSDDGLSLVATGPWPPASFAPPLIGESG
ncbi:MAG: GvpL/GvpF family gas vesicle protein [Gemmataceae bacterium]|nr:GvpL/GvpF family gas vesicle protein [Gemmataceae bacterium]